MVIKIPDPSYAMESCHTVSHPVEVFLLNLSHNSPMILWTLSPAERSRLRVGESRYKVLDSRDDVTLPPSALSLSCVFPLSLSFRVVHFSAPAIIHLGILSEPHSGGA